MRGLRLLEFLPFSMLVGALARLLLTEERRGGGWTALILAGAAGGLAGALLGRLSGSWPDEGPQGFALSLVGALASVVAYHALSERKVRT